MQPSSFFYPLVSVIIPVYNREDYIEEALESILQETYPNLEIVVIDDGSTDNTAEIILNWQRTHASIIRLDFLSRVNKGVTSTLNELIQRSRGEYIVFFGSDDCLINDGIQKRYKYLQQHRDKKMVVGDCHLIDSNSQIIHQSAYEAIGKADKFLMETDAGMQKHIILNGYIPGATLMAHKSIYEEFGYYPEHFSSEDWTYYVRVIARNRLGFLNTIVASYRIHENNTCYSRTQLKIAKEQLNVMLTLFDDYRGKNRLYLLQRVAFQLVYIPYLSLKFNLIDASHSSEKPSLSVLVFRFILSNLNRFKNAVMNLMGAKLARI